MKKIIVTAIALMVAGVLPASATMCVQSRDIQSTNSKDGKLLTFRMRDGRVFVNHLQGTCSDLRFEGFSWILRGTDDVCENQQSLRVLRSGQICILCKFDVVKDKPVKAP